MPARIYGHREGKEEKIEFLLLNMKDDIWECLSKPGKKAKIGSKIIFSDKLSAEVVDISEDGSRFLKFDYDGIFEEILDELGEMPLPPYITEKLKVPSPTWRVMLQISTPLSFNIWRNPRWTWWNATSTLYNRKTRG